MPIAVAWRARRPERHRQPHQGSSALATRRRDIWRPAAIGNGPAAIGNGPAAIGNGPAAILKRKRGLSDALATTCPTPPKQDCQGQKSVPRRTISRRSCITKKRPPTRSGRRDGGVDAMRVRSGAVYISAYWERGSWTSLRDTCVTADLSQCLWLTLTVGVRRDTLALEAERRPVSEGHTHNLPTINNVLALCRHSHVHVHVRGCLGVEV